MRVRAHVGLAVPGDLPAVLTRASGLGFGAGGFFVVVSGAHAYIVTHNPHRVSNGGWKFIEFLRGLHLAPSG